MSYASARAFGTLGPGLRALGQVIGRKRRLDAEDEIARQERERQNARQDMQTDVTLAGLGGGRGAPPTETRVLPEITPDLAGVPPVSKPGTNGIGEFGDTSFLPGANEIGGFVPPPAPRTSRPAPTLTTSEYVPVGKGAYILKPEIRAQREEARRLAAATTAARAEHNLKTELEAPDRARGMAEIGRVIAGRDPTFSKLPPDQQEQIEGAFYDKVGGLDFNAVYPNPRMFAPQRPTPLGIDDKGNVIMLGPGGDVISKPIPGGGAGIHKVGTATSDAGKAKATATQRLNDVNYIGGLITGGNATAPDSEGTVNTQFLQRQLTDAGRSPSYAVAVVGEAMKKFGSKLTPDVRPVKIGGPGAAAQPTAAQPAATQTPGPDPGLRQFVANYKRDHPSATREEGERAARSAGLLK